MTTEERYMRLADAEMQVTEICLRGEDMVPAPEDMTKLTYLSREIFDLTGGRNEVVFSKDGRPSIVVNFFCDETARLDWLSDNNKFFQVPSSWTAPTDGSKQGVHSIHPAFLFEPLNRETNQRGSLEVMAGFSVGKYPDVRVSGKNYHMSLRGLPPAYGNSRYTESYNGIASQCDTINSATVMPEAPYIANINLAIWSYLTLRSLKEGFQCRGNTSYGKSNEQSVEFGEPCGSIENGRVIHTKGGSGSLMWYHDGTPEGIWGLVGNCWEILHGYFIVDGELQFVPYNNAADSTAALLTQESADFYAMNENGNFVAKGSDGTLKYDFVEDLSEYTEGGGKAYELCKNIIHSNMSNTNVYGNHGNFQNLQCRESELPTTPVAAQLLLRVALDEATVKGYCSARWYTGCVRIAVAGGCYGSGGGAGLCAFFGSYWDAGYNAWDGSGRVAFIRRNWDIGRIGV